MGEHEEKTMTWAKLIAVVDGGPGTEAVARSALRLGRAFAARVELLHVQVPVEEAVPAIADGISAGTLEQIIEGLRERAEVRAGAASALCERLCAAEGQTLSDPDAAAEPGTFRVAYRLAAGREADEVAARGRLADLVIVAGAMEGDDQGFSPALEAALFETGGPVLMVPGAVSEDFGDAVAVAWDGTMEAARAARAALPLLERAGSVFVLTADMDKARAKPSQLAGYLAQRGIEAKTWAFRPEGGSMGDALLAEAREAGADMLVMGAYGHSRLRELVLGGVTRSVTAKAEIPVLMAH